MSFLIWALFRGRLKVERRMRRVYMKTIMLTLLTLTLARGQEGVAVKLSMADQQKAKVAWEKKVKAEEEWNALKRYIDARYLQVPKDDPEGDGKVVQSLDDKKEGEYRRGWGQGVCDITFTADFDILLPVKCEHSKTSIYNLLDDLKKDAQ
jgi:hypothetical protein